MGNHGLVARLLFRAVFVGMLFAAAPGVLADDGCLVTDPRLHIVPDSAGKHEVACLRVP